MEIILTVLVVVWVLLFYIERMAGRATKLGRYGWMAHSARLLLAFGGFGLFLIFVGTDWHNRFLEWTIGIICILLGVGLCARSVLRRKEIQAGLGSGSIKQTGIET